MGKGRRVGAKQGLSTSKRGSGVIRPQPLAVWPTVVTWSLFVPVCVTPTLSANITRTAFAIFMKLCRIIHCGGGKMMKMLLCWPELWPFDGQQILAGAGHSPRANTGAHNHVYKLRTMFPLVSYRTISHHFVRLYVHWLFIWFLIFFLFFRFYWISMYFLEWPQKYQGHAINDVCWY